MSFTVATESPVIRIVDGQEFKFPKPKRKQVGDLMRKWAAEDRAEFLKQLTDCAVSGKEKLAAVQEFEDRARLIGYGYRCLYEFDRAGQAILLSLGTTDADILDSLPFAPDELTDIACETWGMRRTNDGDVVEGKKKSESTIT